MNEIYYLDEMQWDLLSAGGSVPLTLWMLFQDVRQGLGFVGSSVSEKAPIDHPSYPLGGPPTQ